MKYSILVPKDVNNTSGISGGSAIVTPCDEFMNIDGEEMIRVYYEGNLNRACNLGSLHDRAICAAGRMHVRYPTVAFTVINKNDYIHVGTLNYEGFGMEIEAGELESIMSWLAQDERHVTVNK
jgi:hypothetical protein